MLKKAFIYAFYALRHFKNNNFQPKPLMLNLVLARTGSRHVIPAESHLGKRSQPGSCNRALSAYKCINFRFHVVDFLLLKS